MEHKHTSKHTNTTTPICCCCLTHMPRPLLLGYFLHQCLESIPGVVFVTPAAVHGHMSGCLFIPRYKCVHMFVAGAGSECVTHNLIHRDEAVFTTCGPDRRRQSPNLSLQPFPVFFLLCVCTDISSVRVTDDVHYEDLTHSCCCAVCFINSAAVMLVKSLSD